MAKAQVRVLPSARNTVMVVDDQSTGRAILEQVVRSLDERVVVEGAGHWVQQEQPQRVAQLLLRFLGR